MTIEFTITAETQTELEDKIIKIASQIESARLAIIRREQHDLHRRREAEAKKQNRVDDHFGICPHCYRHDGYINVEKNVFFVCHDCKTCWCAGYGIFSSWQQETPEIWNQNKEMLSGYSAVRPTCWREVEDEIAF